MNKFVKCPTCKKNVEWTSASPHRPFCCERCRLIDLGEWASESHSIPSDPIHATEEAFDLINENFD